jgi:transcriptional regulator NrdR family protein
MDGSTTQRKSWPQGEDNRGLVCRHCGCKHFRVTYTRPAWGDRISRRRECRHCGRRVTTWERATGETA